MSADEFRKQFQEIFNNMDNTISEMNALEKEAHNATNDIHDQLISDLYRNRRS